MIVTTGNPLHELNRLSMVYKKEKHPNFPEHCLVKSNYSDKSANDLTKCVMDFLKFNKQYAVRINTTGQYVAKLDKWVKGSTTRGTADIHATIKGRHVSIEIKFGRDKQSLNQLKVQKQVEDAGGVYIIVKDFASFYNWYNDFVGGANG